MSGPVRVLHVFGRLQRGGAETMVMNLYRKIDRSQFQFDFTVCTDEKDAYVDEIVSLGGQVHHMPRFSAATAISYRRAWVALLKKHPEYTIIHGHLRSSAAIYLRLARRFGRVTVAHSHSTSSGSGISAYVKDVLQLPIRYTADYLLACSDAAGRWLYGENAVKKDNYLLLPNAIDTTAFTYSAPRREAARASLGVGDRLVIGHVGSFLPVKNHAFLLDVFATIRARRENTVLLLVGDGPLMDEIKRLTAAKGLDGHVLFTGARSDVSELLQAMDVFVLPSKWEGLPLTAVEAQTAGLPCLLSDTISPETKLTPLVSFLPLSSGADAWAEMVLRVADHVRQGMSNAVRRAGYDITESAQRVQAFYRMALDQHGYGKAGEV